MKKAQMKEFLREMGRMQEEDYVTTEELYKIFNTVLEAVKKSQLDNSGKLKELDSYVDTKSKELETYFKTLLEAVDDRMKQVQSGADGKDGETPVAGVDYPDYQEIRDFITEAVDKLPTPDDPAATITVDYIKDQLMALEGHDRLPHTAIDGIEDFIDEKVRLMEANLRRGPMAITGGGTGSGSGSGTTSPLTTKGDLWVYTTTDARLGVGSDNQVLVADSAEASGVKWATLAGSGDVTKVGTPVDGQIGVWTGDGTIEGDASLTFDTTDDTLVIAASGKLAFGAVDVLSDSAGTTTLSNIDAVDATTDATFTALVDTAAVTAAGALMDSEVDADIKTLSLPANTTISTFGASLVDDADAATARTTLGAGTGDGDFLADGTVAMTGNLNINTQALEDANSNELLKFTTNASAVNEITIANAATGSHPEVQATGGDTNIDLFLRAKGTGQISMASDVDMSGNNIAFSSGQLDINDPNGNEVWSTSYVASAVNEITVVNAATGNGPEIQATGTDTNIDIELIPKGTGDVVVTGSIQPSSDGGGDMGAAGTAFSSVYLSTGGVVDFSNGDITIQESGDTLDIKDISGNEIVTFDKVASAVNELTFVNAATGNGPEIQATGTDSNVDIELVPKGTGIVKGELKRFMVRLVASDTDNATGTTIGGDYRISSKAITVKDVGAYVDTAGTTGTMTVDINEAGTTIMTTNKITIDTGEKSSETAATAPAVTDTAIAADAVVTFDVDGIHTTAAKGLTVWIEYVYA